MTTGASPCSTRWPRLALPAAIPAISSGTTARIQQRHDPAHRPHKPLRLARAPVHVLGPVDRVRTSFGSSAASTPAAARPVRFTVAADVLALGVGHLFRARQRPRRPSSQRPRPPAVGAPSLNATFHEGRSAALRYRPAARARPRPARPAAAAWNRCVTLASAASSRSRVSRSCTRRPSSASAPAIMRAGIFFKPNLEQKISHGYL